MYSGRGTAIAEDAKGTPTQSHISPSILKNEGPSHPKRLSRALVTRGDPTPQNKKLWRYNPVQDDLTDLTQSRLLQGYAGLHVLPIKIQDPNPKQHSLRVARAACAYLSASDLLERTTLLVLRAAQVCSRCQVDMAHISPPSQSKTFLFDVFKGQSR